MYQKILVPLDGSDLAESVLPHVEAVVRGCGVPKVILIRAVEGVHLHTGEGTGYYIADVEPQSHVNRVEEARRYLDVMAGKLDYGPAIVETYVAEGRAAESIADYATRNNIDLIIMATHGRSGPSRWALGSVADRVLRSNCAPVLLVRAPGCMPGF